MLRLDDYPQLHAIAWNRLRNRMISEQDALTKEPIRQARGLRKDRDKIFTMLDDGSGERINGLPVDFNPYPAFPQHGLRKLSR